ncbi:ParB/RepB/Spo0J family partition protein [Bradyrhizobium sp. SZCCHNRI2049]|uniref:ParB/RepB/Spo0J family partition protein n=1 Tax=Bradyrhizobium sp. SZCCHNRI2049 TaxID=3057287 RepID=UPI002915F282|nr:ParB/RepB/Spo0J family partition protein [Bradyrhizobium sp. SZCCHNRI2049]
MADRFRSIDTSDYAAIEVPADFGVPPRLEWIAISDLVIDEDYQRGITAQGRTNVRRIAAGFGWALFAPIVVAPADDQRFAIVDGQHRATAAKLAGLDRVPCAIIAVDRALQAKAFAGINGQVTRMQGVHLFHAAVAAGDPDAVRTAMVCKAAGVSIVRNPTQANQLKAGETNVATALTRAILRHGNEAAIAALKAIVGSRNGNAGMLSGTVILGAIAALAEAPHWIEDQAALARAFEQIDLKALQNKARVAAAGTPGATAIDRFKSLLTADLARRLPAQAEPVEAAPPRAAPRPVTSAPVPPPQPAVGPSRAETINGVVIELASGGEGVGYGGRFQMLSPHQAKLVRVLARAMPAPIDLNFIASKYWGAAVPAGAAEKLRAMTSNLKPLLANIGLELKEIRGVSLQLRESA